MDISAVASRLGLAGSKSLIRKAEELRRFSDVQFDSSIIGVVSTSMGDLCFDVFGISKEKKNPKAVKGHRAIGFIRERSNFISLIFSVAAPLKAKKQATLKFTRKSPSSIALEAL
ncbi:hypothetical protein BHE74_00034588 [Ensete ventricosum]|nr:hypothetical protein GW17_00002346 [Ensete ventricosum]RWW58527.1 hypothetical protein BHE74_00034588 [Ensete ventricosum]